MQIDVLPGLLSFRFDLRKKTLYRGFFQNRETAKSRHLCCGVWISSVMRFKNGASEWRDWILMWTERNLVPIHRYVQKLRNRRRVLKWQHEWVTHDLMVTSLQECKVFLCRQQVIKKKKRRWTFYIFWKKNKIPAWRGQKVVHCVGKVVCHFWTATYDTKVLIFASRSGAGAAFTFGVVMYPNENMSEWRSRQRIKHVSLFRQCVACAVLTFPIGSPFFFCRRDIMDPLRTSFEDHSPGSGVCVQHWSWTWENELTTSRCLFVTREAAAGLQQWVDESVRKERSKQAR